MLAEFDAGGREILEDSIALRVAYSVLCELKVVRPVGI